MSFKWFYNLVRGYLEENPLVYICFAGALALGALVTVIVFLIVRNIKGKATTKPEKKDISKTVSDVQEEFESANTDMDFDAKIKLMAVLLEKVADAVGSLYYPNEEDKHTLFEGASIKEDGFTVVMKFNVYEFVSFVDELFVSAQESMEKSMACEEFVKLYEEGRKQYSALNEDPRKASLLTIRDVVFITMKSNADETGLSAIQRFISGFAHKSAEYDVEFIGPGVVSIVDSFCLDLIPRFAKNIDDLYSHQYEDTESPKKRGGKKA